MNPEFQNRSLLRTKLNRPPVPADHVPRTELLKRLDKHLDRPMVLVSAPAGYGKSTLASFWLEQCKKPGAWLSLDESDDSLSLTKRSIIQETVNDDTFQGLGQLQNQMIESLSRAIADGIKPIVLQRVGS